MPCNKLYTVRYSIVCRMKPLRFIHCKSAIPHRQSVWRWQWSVTNISEYFRLLFHFHCRFAHFSHNRLSVQLSDRSRTFVWTTCIVHCKKKCTIISEKRERKKMLVIFVCVIFAIVTSTICSTIGKIIPDYLSQRVIVE